MASRLEPLRGEIERSLRGGEPVKALAVRLGVARSTLRDYIRQHNIETTTLNGDDADLTVNGELPDTKDLLRSRGLSAEEWEVTDCIVNEWDSPTGETLRQFKLHCRRKIALDLIVPAAARVPRAQPVARRHRDKPELIAYLSDQHAPYHDPGAHQAVLQFLVDKKPDKIVLGGDGGDYGTISKHRDNPAWAATPNECIQGEYELNCDYRDATPNAEIVRLPGNHDARLATEQLLRAERMFAVRPARKRGAPEEDQAHSLRRLLHLDDLHITYIGPPREGDNYEHAEVLVAPDLVATHGFLTGPTAAQKHVEAMGQSVIFGHTHAQRLYCRVEYRGGRPYQLWGVEAGCLCLIEGGLGYAKRPKWNQGFATATVWPDGSFQPELARYVDGRLYWRNEQWRV